jgi:hypothetical protein
MKVKLLQRIKVWHKAGDTVEVSPEEADFLISVGAAEKVVKKETKK